LDTCKRVSKKILEKNNHALAIADTTVYHYTLKSRDELYGKPFD